MNKDGERLVRLHALTAALARRGLTPEAVARTTAFGACEAIGGTRAALGLLDPAGNEHVAAATDPAPDAATPSSVVVALTADGIRIGTLTVAREGTAAFDDGDRALAAVLAQHAANAIHRARAAERDRRYQDRLRILADAGELLASTIDYEKTLRNVVRIPMPALADFCFVDVREAPGEVRRVVGVHDDDALEELLAPMRWAPPPRTDMNLCALSSGATGFHPKVDDAWMQAAATSHEHLELLRRLGLRSMITAPLVSGGVLLGALTACFGRSARRHREGDVAVVEELAQRAAAAIDNALLFRTAHDATLRAEEANRLKDEFLATVSHELRTPLSAILGWATLLRAEDAGAAAVGRGLEVIERNARAQQRIIEDILDVSRIITGKLRIDMEPVDLPALLADVLESVRPSAEAKSLELAFTPPRSPCRIAGDSVRLRQIFWNLASNAVKFTPEGGRVTLAIVQTGDRVDVRVEDTGRGIDEAFLAHAFERFRQGDSSTTRQHGGLGLGLAIVRHLAEMHGGTVTATSEGPGRGAAFTVTLPVRPFSAPVTYTAPPEESRPDASDALAALPARPLAGIRVLVVEDEPDSRELIHILLESEGAEVRSVASADAALAALDGAPTDVLLSDIGMPGKDGLWLAARVRELREDLPMVALTAYSGNEDIARAIAAGFDHHVAKPVDPAQLVLALSACGRRSISAA